jgi:hypothetical protein
MFIMGKSVHSFCFKFHAHGPSTFQYCGIEDYIGWLLALGSFFDFCKEKVVHAFLATKDNDSLLLYGDDTQPQSS